MALKTGALLAILGVALVGVYMLMTMPQFLNVTPKPVVAHVQLVNNCPLRESAFRVQDLTTGRLRLFLAVMPA